MRGGSGSLFAQTSGEVNQIHFSQFDLDR